MTILSKSHIETNYCCEIFTNFTMKKVEIDGAFHLAEFYLSLPGMYSAYKLNSQGDNIQP